MHEDMEASDRLTLSTGMSADELFECRTNHCVTDTQSRKDDPITSWLPPIEDRDFTCTSITFRILFWLVYPF